MKMGRSLHGTVLAALMAAGGLPFLGLYTIHAVSDHRNALERARLQAVRTAHELADEVTFNVLDWRAQLERMCGRIEAGAKLPDPADQKFPWTNLRLETGPRPGFKPKQGEIHASIEDGGLGFELWQPCADGLLVARFPVDRPLSSMQELTALGREQILVIDGRGMLVHHPDPLKVAHRETVVARDLLFASAPEILLQQGEYLLVRTPIRDLGWHVVMERPRAEVLAPVQRRTQKLGVLLIPWLLALFVVSRILAHRSLRPLDVFQKRLAAVEHGDLTEPSEFHGPVEFEQMAQSVEVMARAVERREQAKQRELAQSLERLNEAHKELEQFTGRVSHDILAPIRSIDGLARLLEVDHRERLDGEPRQLVTRIRSACRRLQDLVNDLLALSRLERLELRTVPLDLSRLAREVLDEQRLADARRNVVIEIQKDLRARADPGLTRALFQNLLQNSWKYTARRETAHITVSGGQDPSTGWSVFEVKDDGVGFDPARADRLFQPFERLHPASEFEGTGMGLAICRRIVQRHGGRIEARSEVGQGATFTVHLPPGADP